MMGGVSIGHLDFCFAIFSSISSSTANFHRGVSSFSIYCALPLLPNVPKLKQKCRSTITGPRV